MAYELVYTSVPQGIRTGSSGFCTVAYTNGLSASMVLKLEGMSAYKNYFQPNDPNADANPVAYSHYSLMESGQQIHILSRVSYYGLDYTMRSNKLAHHVAALARECYQSAAGPAAVAAQQGFFRTAWQEEPRLFPTRKELPRIPETSGIAGVWQQYTGDAGWAGVLAQSFLDSPRKAVFIIFDPLKHVDTLSLVEEALRLLPPEKRWQVNFNTYFTMLPAGMNCHWRFCVPGADVLQVARSTPGTLVIDLTSKLPAAGEGELQQMARSGGRKKLTMPVKSSAPMPPSPPSPPSPPLPLSQPPPPSANTSVVPVQFQEQVKSVPPQIVYDISGSSRSDLIKKHLLIGGALLLVLIVAAGVLFIGLKPEKSSNYTSGFTSGASDDNAAADGIPGKNDAENSTAKNNGNAETDNAVKKNNAAGKTAVAKKPGAKQTTAKKQSGKKPSAKKTAADKKPEADVILRNRRELWWHLRKATGKIETTKILYKEDTLYAAVLSDGREKKTVEVVNNEISEGDPSGATTLFKYTVAVKNGCVIIGAGSKWKITALVIKDAAGKKVQVPLVFEYGKCDVPKKYSFGTLHVKLYKDNITFSFEADAHERIIREKNPDGAIVLTIGEKSYPLDFEKGKFSASWENDLCDRYFLLKNELPQIRKVVEKIGEANKQGKKKEKKLSELKKNIAENWSAREKQTFARLLEKYPAMTAQNALEQCKKDFEELNKQYAALKKWDRKQIRVEMKINGKMQLLRRFDKVQVNEKGVNIK